MESSQEEEILQPGEDLPMDVAECLWPLLESRARLLGIHGGRGASKSWFAADFVLARMVQDPNLGVACLREVQGSLDQSCKRLLEIRIHDHKLEDYFEITSTQIRIRADLGSGIIFFRGLSKLTESGIKSLESIGLVWLEEAQTIQQTSLDTLLPTIRQAGSQILSTWNPDDETVPIDALMRGKNRAKNCCTVEINYWDNPFLTEELKEQIEHAKLHDPEKYAWIWCGGYRKFSEARVFKKNWKVEAFETPRTATLLYGVDWGYNPDPTVLIRGYFDGPNRLYIDKEAWQVKCLPRDTPALFLRVPESENHPLRCADDRPERIADIRAAGFDAISVLRQPNSLQEGIAFLEGIQIIIHPDCVHTAAEFGLYSRKVDKLTGQPTSEFEDKNDHCISAIRSLSDETRRLSRVKLQVVKPTVDASLTSHWSSGRR